MSQLWTRMGERSLLRTRIATTETVSLCARQQNGKEMRGRHSVYRTKVLYAAVENTVKSVFDHVIRPPNALSAEVKGSVGGLTFAEAPLGAISRSNWSRESARSEAAVQSAS